MDRINIGMKAQRAEEIGNQLIRAGADALNRAGDDDVPPLFELELEARDNNSGDQVIIVFNNDDMERDEVALQDMYVEVDE